MVKVEKLGVSRLVSEKRISYWVNKGFKVVEPPKPKAPAKKKED